MMMMIMFGSRNKKRLPYTAFTDWYLYRRRTARYELNTEIKLRFIFTCKAVIC